MNAVALRERLAAAGLTVAIEGEELRCGGPLTARTPALMAELEAGRPALLALLREEKAGAEREREPADGPADEPAHEPENEEEGEDDQALREQIAPLPVEEQLIYLGFLQCRICRRWLLVREFEPDAHARPVCIDRTDCWEAARRVRSAAGTAPALAQPAPAPELHLDL